MKEKRKSIVSLIKSIKSSVKHAKENNLIFSHIKAFDDYSVKKEKHKGNIGYYLK